MKAGSGPVPHAKKIGFSSTSEKFTSMALIGTLALASCNKNTAPEVTDTSKTIAFKAMLPNDAAYKGSAGTAKYIDLNTGDRATTLTATGLKADTKDLAHYHMMGIASTTDACASNGGVLNGMIGDAMMSDANGALTLKGLQNIAALGGAAYINIHEAAALSVVPLCAPLKSLQQWTGRREPSNLTASFFVADWAAHEAASLPIVKLKAHPGYQGASAAFLNLTW
ncbi:hypothetical protein [Deinococcus saxicola]|uniref:hypothetical protein n=1 Tax=Deinococcus saxicola TaxID=249406 RepID=UPI0039EEB5AD